MDEDEVLLEAALDELCLTKEAVERILKAVYADLAERGELEGDAKGRS